MAHVKRLKTGEGQVRRQEMSKKTAVRGRQISLNTTL